MIKIKNLIVCLSLSAAVIALSSCGSTPKSENVSDKIETTVTANEPETKTSLPKKEVTAPDVLPPVDLPDTEMLLLDDFDEGMYFYAVGTSWDQWNSHNLGLECDLSEEWKTNGEYSIKCIHEQAANPSYVMATWCCDSPIDSDWTGYKTLAVDFYNAGPIPATICLQLQTTDSWIWCQTETQTFEPGEKATVLFDISQFGDTNLGDVKRMMLSNMGSDYTFMYFDNMRIFK